MSVTLPYYPMTNVTLNDAEKMNANLAYLASQEGVVGPTGPQGPQGDPGPQGPAGADGFANGYIQTVINGSGSTITTGVKADIRVPFAITLTEVCLLADQTGSIEFDLMVDSYANYPPTTADSIVASAPPAIVSGNKNIDTVLTGWTTSISAESILRVEVVSVTNITRLTLILKYEKQ